MKLAEVFNQLSNGELNQVSIGGQSQGVINDYNNKIIVNHINLGLANLHQRFHLKEGTLNLVTETGKTEYILGSDVLKVNQVFDASGSSVYFTTPSTNVLRIPDDIGNAELDVIYRAGHPIFDTSEDGDIDPDFMEVDLPYIYLEPLLYYVASRVYHPITGTANELHLGSSYAAKYDQACQRLELANFVLDKNLSNDRLTRNGWV